LGKNKNALKNFLEKILGKTFETVGAYIKWSV